MKCTICGYENPDGAMFCKACGAALTPVQPVSEEVKPDEAQPAEEVKPDTAQSEYDPEEGTSILSDDGMKLGQNQFGGNNQFQGQPNQSPFGQPNPNQNQFVGNNQTPFGQPYQNTFSQSNPNQFGQPTKKSKKPLIIGLIAVIAVICCIFFILPMFFRGGAKKATKAGVDNIVQLDVKAMLDTTKDIPVSAYSAFYKVVEENDGTYLFDIYFDDDVKDGKDIKKEVDKILDACNDKDTLKSINKTINSADELTDLIEGAEIKVGATHKLRNTKQIIDSIEKDINGNLDELFKYAKSQDPDLEDDELKKTKQEVKETFKDLKDSSYYEDIVKAGDSFIKKADDACLVDVTITYKKYTFKIQDICFKFDGEWVSVLGNLPSIYIIPAMYRYIDYVE